MSTPRRALAATALLGTAAAAVMTSGLPALADPGPRDRAGAGAAVAELRRTIEPYRDVQRALADGFVATPECAASPDGAMGVHYVHPQRLQAAPDATRPQILLYDAQGRLLGAEFFVPDADQDLSTDDDRPSLFGQPMDGPMPGHDPGMPVHYDLHVWTHEANPAGVFAPWNRRVDC